MMAATLPLPKDDEKEEKEEVVVEPLGDNVVSSSHLIGR